MRKYFGKLLMVGTVGALALSSRAEAQATAAAAPGSAKLLAAWVGDYTTDGPSGTMTLEINKDQSAWKVTNSLGGDVPPGGDVREVQADGEKITWKQIFGEYDVTFKASLSADGTQLTGTMEATQGGTVAGTGSFTLKKKA